ncbi:hypothetical protein RDWZM_007663 [Blomia tropicalis]|uniref:RING-type domain-containing protein n=1 Tax=Blomia tropicalis TaxID=40697 RepID=A0A9Q0RKN2_BLOTA|nr:hypothetical protein RDWZM_007663 [Blomia tropicalis]
MNCNVNHSAPTSPTGTENRQQHQRTASERQQQQPGGTSTNSERNPQQQQQQRANSRYKCGLFGTGTSGTNSRSFDFNNISQNISNSFQDIQDIITNNNPFNDPLMDVRKIFYKSCNSCGNSFSIFPRKKRCQNCLLHFCNSCMEMSIQRTLRCRRCLVFSEYPLTMDSLNTLRIRDLKWFLNKRNIPSDTYSEKRELEMLVDRNPQSRNQSTRTSPQTAEPPPVNRSSTPPPRSEAPTNTNMESSPSPSNINLSSSYPELKPMFAKSHLSNLNISTFNLNDIKDENEIKDLSVRQLKLILTRNFVDFKGCVEREELIQKAIFLWNDRQRDIKFKDENEDNLVIDENICKICMENPIDCVLLECGHMLTCTNCGKILNECPVCRQFVTRVVHVFKA